MEPTALTDTTKPGYYDAKFSPEAGFYILQYDGPSIPWTKVVNSESRKSLICCLLDRGLVLLILPPTGSEIYLEKNSKLANVTTSYESATVVYSTFVSDGYGVFPRAMISFEMYFLIILVF